MKELQDIDLNAPINKEEEEEADLNDELDIVNLRALVKKIRKSVKLRQKLKKLCEIYELKYLVPVLDVKTRWNSTYNMIIRSQHLKVPLNSLCQNESCLRNLHISTRTWENLADIRQVLQKFDRATRLISMERHSTIASYLPTLDWLILSLSDFVVANSGALAFAVEEGVKKLKKNTNLTFQPPNGFSHFKYFVIFCQFSVVQSQWNEIFLLVLM